MVAFDNDQREFLRLEDLDLPSLSQPQKPQKKEILIKEGLNYKAGEGCKWYIEVEEKTYHPTFRTSICTMSCNTLTPCLQNILQVIKQRN